MRVTDHRVVAVVHPRKVSDIAEFRTLLSEAIGEDGGAPGWFETTPDDAGEAATRCALAARPEVVLACGGDGTVNAVASALAHTGVALGIVPLGTGNLIARNLGIPLDIAEAMEIAVTGDVRRIDLGWIGEHLFVGMAGTGLDAVMVRDAKPRLKDLLGWVAYVGPAVRALRAGAVPTRFCTDQGTVGERPLHAAVIGNFGRLQGGVSLLPDADPQDGYLDAALIGRGGFRDWLRAIRHSVTGGGHGGAVESLRFRSMELHAGRPRPVEVDGEPVGDCTSLTVRVDPEALLVKVPRWDP